MTKTSHATEIGGERAGVWVKGDTEKHQEILEALENELLELKAQISKREKRRND